MEVDNATICLPGRCHMKEYKAYKSTKPVRWHAKVSCKKVRMTSEAVFIPPHECISGLHFTLYRASNETFPSPCCPVSLHLTRHTKVSNDPFIMSFYFKPGPNN